MYDEFSRTAVITILKECNYSDCYGGCETGFVSLTQDSFQAFPILEHAGGLFRAYLFAVVVRILQTQPYITKPLPILPFRRCSNAITEFGSFSGRSDARAHPLAGDGMANGDERESFTTCWRKAQRAACRADNRYCAGAVRVRFPRNRQRH